MGRMICFYGVAKHCQEAPAFPSADPRRVFEMAAGRSHHSVVDAIWGYTLDDETKTLLLVRTESGLYEWQRMSIDVSPAPAGLVTCVTWTVTCS